MSNYIITIVGRPNVGKSTLFNRIVGKRDAIVDETPGVTRDRHYAFADWAGKFFTLVDTGGYIPKAESIIEKAMREQVQIAISEANLVLFLCDANDGATPFDFEIADILRKANKKVLLVVNKVDNEKKEISAAQFNQLGLGEPFTISALVGRKIGDLLDVLTQDIPKKEKPSTDTRMKIAVIGKPNVGKSSFVNALLGTDKHIVTQIPGTTRDPIDSILKYYGEEILLIDTAGLRRKSKIKENIEFYSVLRTIRSIERCDIAMLLLDAGQGIDKQDLHIVENVVEHKRGILICVNKWDLIEKDENTAKEFEQKIKMMLRVYDFIPVIFISAKTKQRIFKTIEIAKRIFEERNKRIQTSKLNDVILKVIEHHPPSSTSGKEIKIKHIVQVKTSPPVFTFFVNHPELIQQAYIRFLENKIREKFGFEGVPLTLKFKRK
ncbi:MAG: GTP-binding protein EngA [Ignavibacteriae bacterium]|nr:MAG: GTP-binding protein EngA [Ignavibacteriota bacterium]